MLKFIFSFLVVPFFVVSVIIMGVYVTYADESINKTDPEVIGINQSNLFIYKSGTAINVRQVDKFAVSGPSNGDYRVNAWIGWDRFTIKSGFESRLEADIWLETFLRNIDGSVQWKT